MYDIQLEWHHLIECDMAALKERMWLFSKVLHVSKCIGSCLAYELYMESFLLDDLNYQLVLCSLPVSEHVSKQGGERGMRYRANTANTMRNRQWMKLGFELKCIVMRMSVHGLLKEMVFRCHAQTVHGLCVTVFLMIPPCDLRPTSNIIFWQCSEKLQPICTMCTPLSLLCHIIREQYCYIYIVLPLPDLSVIYYCIMNEWTINYCNSL